MSKAVRDKFISLFEKQPSLLAEWHPTKNGNLQPSDISFGSGRKIWWQCKKCGHEWQSAIYARTAGTGCPICARQRHGGRFDFQSIGIPCGANLVFQPDPELDLVVASDGRSVLCDGVLTSLTSIVYTYFGKSRKNITQYFIYHGQTLLSMMQ